MPMAYNKDLFVDMSQKSSFEDLAAMHLDKKPVKGIVQPPVMPPVRKPHRNTNLLEFMRDVVSTICKHPDSWPFRKPVDTLQLKIPDYHDIVRYPMDLYTIRKRIQNFYYYDMNECIKDFRLLFYNCYLYNGLDSEMASVAKMIEKIFVGEMAKYTEKEVEIPIPIKPSKSKGTGRRNAVSRKTKTCDAETLTTSAGFPFGGNLKPNQCTESSLSVIEPTSQTYNQTAFIATSQANNTTTVMPSNQMNNTSQLWTCPGCGYHSERPQDFMQKPSVGRVSIVQTQQQSAQCSKTHFCERSSSCSSDSSSSSDYKKKLEELGERTKKIAEELECLKKNFNDSKKRKIERQNKRKLKNKLLRAPKQKIVCENESPLVAVLPIHSVPTPASSNNTLNKPQNQKQTQKSSSKHVCAPKQAAGNKKSVPKCAPSSKPTAKTEKSALKCVCSPKSAGGTKKGALKRVCSPKPAAQTKKTKTDCNPPKKQPILAASVCPSPPSIIPNGGFKIKIEDADIKLMSFEEKRKLGDDLSKLGVKAGEAVTIIKHMEPSLYDSTSAVSNEINLEALKPSTLRELQKLVNSLKREFHADDDTRSTNSTSSCSSRSSSSSSSSEHFLVYSDESSSSINSSINETGKENSTANGRSTVKTNVIEAPHPDSTTSPVKMDKIISKHSPAFRFPNLQQTVIKSEPYFPYFEEGKSSFPGPSTSRSVLPLNNYPGALQFPPKDSTKRIGSINTVDVDQQSGYTRITKRVGYAEKKPHLDPDHRRFMEIVENAKKTMKMRENARNRIQNQVNQCGTGEVEIKKEV